MSSTVPVGVSLLSGLYLLLRIRIVVVGKDKDSWVTDGCAHFQKMLSRFARVEFDYAPAAKSAEGMRPADIRLGEAKGIEKRLGRGFNIALTDNGDSLNSADFAKTLDRLQTTSGGIVNLIIGGAHGLDESILKRADQRISLSPLTFSHQLVRLVLLEQLYRGFTIIHNTGYHK